MARIETKKEFERLSQLGLLGNYLRTWQTPDELDNSGYIGYVTIRSRDKQSDWFVPIAATIRCDDIVQLGYGTYWSHLVDIKFRGGPGREAFYFQEVPHPSLVRTANIEVGPIPTAPFFGALAAYIEPQTTKPVRGIRERVRPVYGVASYDLLSRTLQPESMQTLREIWEEYPDALIEASEFPARVGAMKQRLVIWEVRDY